jgi:Holliday junction resolvase RusA-like endonuclease
MSDWHYLEVIPVAKQRARLGRRRKAFTPEKTVAFETKIAELWEQVGEFYDIDEFPAVAVDIEIESHGIWVKVTPLEASHRPVGVRGDVDNYVKAILDGMNTKAWTDDKAVEHLTVKFRGDARKPRRRRTPVV